MRFEINPFDEIALEEAARMKERGEASVVIAITIGEAAAEENLRKALAMGADRAVLVEFSGDTDSLAIAKELAAWVTEFQPDLVLMGKQATDDDSNQVGQMLAALLGWPQATFASKVSVLDGTATVSRETDTGQETVAMRLPAVITADLRLNEPRYIALPGIIKARTKPLDRVTPKTEIRPKTRFENIVLPPARVAGRKVGSVMELAQGLAERGVLAK